MAWSYSDYITYERTDPTRLTRLRLHIKEVSDFISTGSYSVQGKSHTKSELVNELMRLREEEASLSSTGVSSSADSTSPFLRGRGLA